MALNSLDEQSDDETPLGKKGAKQMTPETKQQIQAEEFLAMKREGHSSVSSVNPFPKQGERTREGFSPRETKVELSEKQERQQEVFNSKIFQAVLSLVLGRETAQAES